MTTEVLFLLENLHYVMAWCLTEVEIEVITVFSFVNLSLFWSSQVLERSNWGLRVHLQTSEQGHLPCWPQPGLFPEKEMTATFTAHGSWARREQPNYKELNLFIGKHCAHSTVIRGKRNSARRKDSRTPRLRANCQDQQDVLPLSCFLKINPFSSPLRTHKDIPSLS